MRKISLDLEKEKIIGFIRDYVSSSGVRNGIVGISGGLDSAVTAALAAEALGKEHVKGLMLPYKKSNPDSLNDALTLADVLGIKHEIIDITPVVDSWFDNYEPEASQLRRGNFMARIRMSILYDISAKEDALVLGTGNLSELMIGYTTQYGDNACALEPIGHLYKTEVRKMADKINIPAKIINKEPSADLWQGQTDEGELGLTYSNIDTILYHYFEKDKSKEELVKAGLSPSDIDNVIKLHRKSHYKRELPPVPEPAKILED